jgi:hypothetical protein
MNTLQNDLTELLPLPLELKLGGKTLALSPLKVGELTAFSRAIAPVIAVLQAGDADLLGLIANHTETVVTAVAVAAREPREWINDLTVGELVLLAAKVIEVNADFLSRSVLPQIGQVFGSLNTLATGKLATAGSASPSV